MARKDRAVEEDEFLRAQSGVDRTNARRSRHLVGGDDEIADVVESLVSTSLTTITGPGGVGKTALALAVAEAAEERFPDGVFVIWLAAVRSPEHVAGAVAARLELQRSGGQVLRRRARGLAGGSRRVVGARQL